jgi:hypothetical protein
LFVASICTTLSYAQQRSFLALCGQRPVSTACGA